MLRLWIALLWLIGVSLAPASAEVYRWTDEAGKIHLTDNPDSIPPAYRSRARSAESPAAPAAETPERATRAPEPPALPTAPSPSSGLPEPVTPAATAPTLEAKIADLQQQLRSARQERQTYFERLRSERTVHTTPEFVRQRRQIADLGEALFLVEQRLDTLQSALAEAQRQQREEQAPPLPQEDVLLDQQGHDAAYWQRLMADAREQLRQAQAQRRMLLGQLAATGSTARGLERHGREVLQSVHTLEQLAGEIDAAETTLENVRDTARQAGAPDAWLE